ncbi:MAG: hypothetical protein ACK4VI_02845 [Alphaproteobacteria bacterium]
MNRVPALLSAVFLVAACDARVTWPEEGVWNCENKQDGREISFDTQNPSRGAIGLTSTFIIVQDLNSGTNVRIESDTGWVCVMPSGEIFKMETNLR